MSIVCRCHHCALWYSNDCDSSERVIASARRSLYGKTPASKGSKGGDANKKDIAGKRSTEDTSSSDIRRGTDKMSANKESNAANKDCKDSSAVLRMRETNDNVRTGKVDIQDHSMTDILKNISGELKLLNGRIVYQYQVQTLFIPESGSVAGEFVILFFGFKHCF